MSRSCTGRTTRTARPWEVPLGRQTGGTELPNSEQALAWGKQNLDIEGAYPFIVMYSSFD